MDKGLGRRMSRKLRLSFLNMAAAILRINGLFGPALFKHNKKVKCSYSQHSQLQGNVWYLSGRVCYM